MTEPEADVLLVTRDTRLVDSVRRTCPPAVRLKVLAPEQMTPSPEQRPLQLWLDLDSGCESLETVAPARRVYFYGWWRRAPRDLAPGLFIRKPIRRDTVGVLWAGVLESKRDRPAPFAGHGHHADESAMVPAWILDLNELDLARLARKLVLELPGRLGYGEASLYLLDKGADALRLADSTQGRNVATSVALQDPHTLLARVAQARQRFQTVGPRALRPTCDSAADRALPPPGEASLVVPLSWGEQLLGVLNLTSRAGSATAADESTLDAVFRFCARALQHALLHHQTVTEARLDGLTGLYNYRWAIESLQHEIQRANRYRSPLSLLLVDLDGFKEVNDRLGHTGGDALLKHVAATINRALRQIDAAARIGGDEFVVILPATDRGGGQQVAERILEQFRTHPAVLRGENTTISASIGVCQWRPGWELNQWLDAADQALYQAKYAGRDRIMCDASGAEDWSRSLRVTPPTHEATTSLFGIGRAAISPLETELPLVVPSSPARRTGPSLEAAQELSPTAPDSRSPVSSAHVERPRE